MLRAIDKWLAGYVRSVLRRPKSVPGTRHLMFCVADHFEPSRGQGLETVEKWTDAYPEVFGNIRDSDGKIPQHTFFFPQEEYEPRQISALSSLCDAGCGEVEIQLHHRNDSAEGLRRKLIEFRDVLRGEHGLLGRDQGGQVRYGFVHGNWALCNSRPDGDWCGVNGELGVLSETGCYADFTFPSAPSPTQPRMVNEIYRAVDAPCGGPCGADSGIRAIVGELNHGGTHEPELSEHGSGQASTRRRSERSQKSLNHGNASPFSATLQWESAEGEAVAGGQLPVAGRADDRGQMADDRPVLQHSVTPSLLPASAQCPGLMLITGPLALNWRWRKWGILPRLENAEISGNNPPVPGRLDLWVNQAIGIAGRPEWVFVKVHTHGCVESNMRELLGESMLRMHQYLAERYNDKTKWALHYVTAREMYNIVRAGECGLSGNPGEYRDFEIFPPERGGKL